MQIFAPRFGIGISQAHVTIPLLMCVSCALDWPCRHCQQWCVTVFNGKGIEGVRKGCKEFPTTEVTEGMKLYNTGSRCQKSQLNTTSYDNLQSIFVLRSAYWISCCPGTRPHYFLPVAVDGHNPCKLPTHNRNISSVWSFRQPPELNSVTLKMDWAASFATSIKTYYPARWKNPGDSHRSRIRRENLKNLHRCRPPLIQTVNLPSQDRAYFLDDFKCPLSPNTVIYYINNY